MKTRALYPLLFFGFFPFLFSFSAPMVSAQGQNVQTVFQEGVRLFQQENFSEALEKFEAVLRVRPDYVYARSYAARCKTMMAAGTTPRNQLESQLGQLVIPEVNFAEAPLGDVLEYFAVRARELSDGKMVPNFIYKSAPADREKNLSVPVTLSLRNVPMTEAIRYVGQLTRTRFTYEQHAVVAEPFSSGGTTQSGGEPSDSEESGSGLFGGSESQTSQP